MVRVAFAGTFAASFVPRVRAVLAVPCDVVVLADEAGIVARLPEVDVSVTIAFTREMGGAARRLRLVRVPGASLDRIDRAALPASREAMYWSDSICATRTCDRNAQPEDEGVSKVIQGSRAARRSCSGRRLYRLTRASGWVTIDPSESSARERFLPSGLVVPTGALCCRGQGERGWPSNARDARPILERISHENQRLPRLS
jgi:hypothetical protein